jgi:hypothetical protein
MLSLLALALLAQIPAAASESPRHQLVGVAPAELASRPALLAQIGVDHVATNGETGELEFAVDPDERAALTARGVRYRVLVDDLEAFYASRLTAAPDGAGPYGTWLSPPFASGAMGGYYTFAQVASVLDQIAAAYPSIVAPKQSIATTGEGRALWMLKISDNPLVDEPEPEMRIDAMHHAREPGAMQTTLWFVLWLVESYGSDPLATYLVNERELYVIPCVNPDGYVYNQTTNPGGGGLWRKNRRVNGGGSFGVDPNRNWPEKWGWDDSGSSPSPSSDTYRGPSPGSEPETAGLVAFSNARSFRTSLSMHTYSNLWMYPFGYDSVLPANAAQYDEVAVLATEISHYVVGPVWSTIYPANGVSVDWDHNVRGTFAWTPEVGSQADGFWPPTNRIIPLAEENRQGIQRTLLAAGAYVRPLSLALVDAGDGDGFFEPGESVQVLATARNSGRAATATPVMLGLSTSSTDVAVLVGSQSLGAIGSFAQASNSASPLALSIYAYAAGGANVDLDVTIAYEGYTQLLPMSFTVGEPIPFVRDDVELDLGWTKGAPGDTATTGKWVRGDPIGTSNAGQPCNPEDDATPAPGVQCMVTGNGGGAAGNDDVDNGFTTLISPSFDLSGVGPATISYARWFANLTNPDDGFAIAISNDDGQSWTPLETVALTQNSWTRPSFEIGVPQTAKMRLRFTASDLGSASLVEAAIDDLEVRIYDSAPRLNVYGKPQQGAPIRFNVTGQPGQLFQIVYVAGPPPPGPFFASTRFAGQSLKGTIPAGKLAQLLATVPSGPAWAGKTISFRAGVGSPGTWTNWSTITIQ